MTITSDHNGCISVQLDTDEETWEFAEWCENGYGLKNNFMEALTVQQELHQLSISDLYAIRSAINEDHIDNMNYTDKVYYDLEDLICTEINRRIDLIKSKI